jgi:molybdopterin converting factor small subunit
VAEQSSRTIFVPRRGYPRSKMKIHLKSIGDLRDYFGQVAQEIELHEGASFGDLSKKLGERWGSQLPAYLWDGPKNRFRGAVYFVMDGHAVQDFDTPLEDGSEVILMRAISGG